MSIAAYTITAGPTPQVINPNFKKPMTRCTLIGITGNGQTTILVQGQTFFISAGLGVRFEQPGPITISGNGDGVFVVAEQSDNYQLSGQLFELLVYSTSGGGGGNTYSADGITLSLSGNTFSVKNGGIDTTQLANNAVDATKLDASVAGAGLLGGGGSALSVNIDNSTIDLSILGSLQVANNGITANQLADGSVTSAKLGNNSVTLPKLAGGTVANPQLGRCWCIDAVGQPAPLDYILISADNGSTVQSYQFVAGSDFAIGATAQDTLVNLVAAINLILPNHVVATIDSTNSYAILQPNVANYPYTFYPNVSDSVYVIITANTTGGAFVDAATSDVILGSAPSWPRSIQANYAVRVVPTADDVTRGFLAVKPDPTNLWYNTAPFLFCQRAGVMTPIGCAVVFDGSLIAWKLANTGTDDYQAGDQLLLINPVLLLG